MFKTLGKIVPFFVFACLLSACASVPMAPDHEDQRAKQFTASETNSIVYIYRDENLGAGLKLPILIDNQHVADTVAKSYIVKELAPGEHIITSKSEKDSSLSINAVAGKIYYVWQEIKMGLISARTKLQLVSEDKGQKAISSCKLIASEK